MYKETKMQEFNDARQYWINETLNMARWENGLAGYLMWDGRSHRNIHQPNFLEGTTGIAMTMLGFLSEDLNQIGWDRCFLLS
jgi:hypothetical protein